MALRPKVVKLCKVVGGLTGTVNKIDENAPEYYSLASILTDEECDVAIAAGLRKERTAAYLAQKVGRPEDEVRKIAEHLAWIGVFRINNDPKTGKDLFFMRNPKLKIFPLSAKTGEGFEPWIAWLRENIAAWNR